MTEEKPTLMLMPGVDGRVETGVMRFGKDHPGIFMRGDGALAAAHNLKMLLDKLDATPAAKRLLYDDEGEAAMHLTYLRSFQVFLQTCDVKNG